MIIIWENQEEISPKTMTTMQKALISCAECEGIKLQCAVHIRFCDDETIRAINREFRAHDRSTDVLSFPTIQYPVGKTAASCEKLLRQEFDDELDACFLGDIILSIPHIMKQAEEYGHSAEREGVYLLVHGVCHLMGYDHETEEDKRTMRAMEEKILSSVSIP